MKLKNYCYCATGYHQSWCRSVTCSECPPSSAPIGALICAHVSTDICGAPATLAFPPAAFCSQCTTFFTGPACCSLAAARQQAPGPCPGKDHADLHDWQATCRRRLQ